MICLTQKIAKLLPDVFTTIYTTRLRHSLRLQRIIKHKRELECITGSATVFFTKKPKNLKSPNFIFLMFLENLKNPDFILTVTDSQQKIVAF